MSACLGGTLCGWDGTNNGVFPSARMLLEFDNVRIVPFCPEDLAYGTPREMSDIHGGDGFDVLDGNARVLSESGKDWTDAMIKASEQMLDLAPQENVELAVLMDVSAACGSQVIYLGNRLLDEPVRQIGVGTAAAQLIRGGIKVISQRDLASLELLYNKLDPSHEIDTTAVDHLDTQWVRENLLKTT